MREVALRVCASSSSRRFLRAASVCGTALLASLASLAISACGTTQHERTSKLAGPPLLKDAPAASSALGIVTVGEVPSNVAGMTDRIWKLAARARELTPKEPVKLSVLPGQKIVEVVKAHVAKEVPAEEIRAEGRCFETLGLIPVGYDYEGETYALLEEELAGLYLPEDKIMYVAANVDEEELDGTLAHELVHALQDQYFQIGEKMHWKPGASDELGAIQALAEGDATSAMFDEMILARGGEDALREHSAADMQDLDAETFLEDSLKDKPPTSLLRKAPRFLAVGLLAPYADGLAFVNQLRRRGGWKAVDAAWLKPPISTEQLLHMAKYDAMEAPIVVPPATASALGAGWKQTYDDVFGEEEGRLALEEWMSLNASKATASGWAGDRVTMFESAAGKHTVAWQLVFDDDGDASEAYGNIWTGWTTAFGTPSKLGTATFDLDVYGAPPPKGDASKKKKDAKSDASSLPPLPDSAGAPPPKAAASAVEGCHVIRHSGRNVTLLAGVPCDLAAAWSAEIAKGP